MITQPFLDLLFLVLVVLRDREKLRCATLARHQIRGVTARCSRRSAWTLHDVVHCANYGVPVDLVIDVDIGKALRGGYCPFSSQRVLVRGDHAWPIADAACGQSSRSARELQWRSQHVALANYRNNGFTKIPTLVGSVTERALLPFARRDKARSFATDVDAGLLSESEAIEVFVHVVDADVDAYLVEIDVTGLRERVVEIDFSMTFTFPVTIPMCRIRQHEESPAHGLARQVGCAGFESGQCEHRFDRRSRRVSPFDGSIKKRTIEIPLQLGKLCRRHADCKQVRVE